MALANPVDNGDSDLGCDSTPDSSSGTWLLPSILRMIVQGPGK